MQEDELRGLFEIILRTGYGITMKNSRTLAQLFCGVVGEQARFRNPKLDPDRVYAETLKRMNIPRIEVTPDKLD